MNGKANSPRAETAGASSRPGTALGGKVVFKDNDLARALFGPHGVNLARIEQRLGVSIAARGNEVLVAGDATEVEMAVTALHGLHDRLSRGLSVDDAEVDSALRHAVGGASAAPSPATIVHTRKKPISPRSPAQGDYIRAIDAHELVFGLGPAGTGKTYLAVAKAVECLIDGRVDRVILSRPAVEAGEQLGFLPGSMREKVDPYLRPLYDALYDMLPESQVAKKMESGAIEVAPLAFMRGRTLANAFVILDEAQNTTAVQMKMFLTRLGDYSRMVVTGDLSQVDLPRGTRSGLRDAIEILEGVEGVAEIVFARTDVVRHPLVTRIVDAYDRADRRHRAGARYERDLDGEK